MIFRTLLFFLVMYLLIKVISRLFLPSDSKKKSRKGSNFFYQMYQQQQNQQNRNSRSQNSSKQNFDQIEEAEFEEITDEEKTTSKSSD
ncbi:MAG: hypothetical protein GWN00_35950 [Aliifodinibius sp.]|jgi:hypothetical protein|nr:hypothetical protein [Fodinibius sp.]NIV16036.1 hypothetical protein [Fodinibius sp.]NIY29989.1 hypothetical protein [Fodinibius sp.]